MGVFCKPGRDPRGWIISCAFSGELAVENAVPVYGDDAIDARWFQVGGGPTAQALTLRHGELTLTAGDLAFDHAEILREALQSPPAYAAGQASDLARQAHSVK